MVRANKQRQTHLGCPYCRSNVAGVRCNLLPFELAARVPRRLPGVLGEARCRFVFVQACITGENSLQSIAQ